MCDSPLRAAVLRFLLAALAITVVLAAAARPAQAEAQAQTPAGAGGAGDEPPPAYEMDRPGEVENPFVLLPGQAQFLAYGVFANAGGRQAEDLGPGGSAAVLQAGARFGLFQGVEGQVCTDTFFSAQSPGADDDDPLIRRSGLGDVTLRAKFTLLRGDDGDAGLGLAPYVRIPVTKALAGADGAEPGLIAPFSLDLGHGWDVEGSSSIDGGHDDGRRVTEEENQAGFEWQFAPAWNVYAEVQVQTGDGPPQWSEEGGVSRAFGKRFSLDLGENNGLGRGSKARVIYLGLAWNL